MIYEYIVKNYTNGEPIFIEEIPGSNKDVIRQELKRLTDNKKLIRSLNGVYFLPYKTSYGTDGTISVNKYIEKKFIEKSSNRIGIYTGLTLANRYGFTTQNPATMEILSNSATTKQRKIEVFNRKFLIYKPLVKINSKNYKTIEFLELMKIINRYSEVRDSELKKKLKSYVEEENIDFEQVKAYISYYPDVVYKNIYLGGLMNELV